MVREGGGDESANVAAVSRTSALCCSRIENGWRESMADTNPQNTNMPNRPEPTHTDQRINPVPDERERAEREANKLAHKGIEREHEFDSVQDEFTK